MKLTRRELGKASAAAAAGVLAPAGLLAQAPPPPQAPGPPQARDWLAEARQSHAAAAKAMARVEVPIAVEPAFRFQA